MLSVIFLSSFQTLAIFIPRMGESFLFPGYPCLFGSKAGYFKEVCFRQIKMEELFRSYIDYLRYERNASAHTILAYERDLADWLAFLAELFGEGGEERYADISSKEVRKWMLKLSTSNLKATTIKRKISAVRSWYSYLRVQGKIGRNPCLGLSMPKEERKLPTYVRSEGLLHLISDLYDVYASSHQHKDLNTAFVVDMLYQTGFRRSELCGIKVEDIHLSKMEIKVLGKRDKERIVPFGSCLLKKIELYLCRREDIAPSHPYLLCTESGGSISPTQLYTMVRGALGAVAGLTKRSPHVLRHSFATSMLNNGSELLSIKELLGHADLSTTTIYTHTSFTELQKMYHAHPRAKTVKRMNINIQANHFELSTQLEAFAEKKVSKLERFLGDIIRVDVLFSLIKPETNSNKEAKVLVAVPNSELVAVKSADSFEQALTEALEAIEKQIDKYKQTHRR